MNKFLYKLDRSIWLSLLNQDKIIESLDFFEKYIDTLSRQKRKPEIKQEIEFAQKLFYTTLFDKSKIYIENQDYCNAILCCNIMFKFDNLHIDAIKNYIKALAKTNQKDLCIDMIEYLRTITNNDKSLYKYFAETFSNLKDYKNASNHLQTFINSQNIDEVSANDVNLLGCYYNYLYNETFDINDINNAIKYYKLAHEKYPEYKIYIDNLCMMLSMTNRREESLQYWKKALAMGLLTNNEAFEYSVFCLKCGNFEEYYKYADSRFIKNNPIYFPKIKGSKWDGTFDISKKTLLVHWEQGFGDTILISGFMGKISTRAKNIIFVVQDALYPLLKNNPYNIKVYADSHIDVDALKYDYWIPAFDVLKVLKIDKNSAIANTDYIKLDKQKVNDYKIKYFNNQKLKIGLSIDGNKIGNKTRNIPVEDLKLLDNINNAEFYILNKDFPDKNLPNNTKNKFINLGKIFNNFENTAIAIENCDLVISADNCILNLAGILNKKTYGLFNWCYEYRWFDLSGEDVVWYKSVKPYINKEMNDWKPTIETVIKEIETEYKVK